jgi:hypothetical protein
MKTKQIKRLDKIGIIYPRFTREENKACKLSDDKIKEIQGLFNLQRPNFDSDKALYKVLAKKYNVHYQTIHYWCKEEYRKMVLRHSIEKEKRRRAENPKLVNAEMSIRKADWRKRKNVKLKDYENKQTRNWYRLREKFIEQHKEEFNKFLRDNSGDDAHDPH